MKVKLKLKNAKIHPKRAMKFLGHEITDRKWSEPIEVKDESVLNSGEVKKFMVVEKVEAAKKKVSKKKVSKKDS